jgi:hypothetical protein
MTSVLDTPRGDEEEEEGGGGGKGGGLGLSLTQSLTRHNREHKNTEHRTQEHTRTYTKPHRSKDEGSCTTSAPAAMSLRQEGQGTATDVPQKASDRQSKYPPKNTELRLEVVIDKETTSHSKAFEDAKALTHIHTFTQAGAFSILKFFLCVWSQQTNGHNGRAGTGNISPHTYHETITLILIEQIGTQQMRHQFEGFVRHRATVVYQVHDIVHQRSQRYCVGRRNRKRRERKGAEVRNDDVRILNINTREHKPHNPQAHIDG